MEAQSKPAVCEDTSTPLTISGCAAIYPGRMAVDPGGGLLWAWGKVGGEGGGALPVPTRAVDRAGDCIYPVPCVIPRQHRFLKASVDTGPFVALDTAGGVWAWHGWSNKGSHWPAAPERIHEGCVDCAAGTSYVVVVRMDGSVWVAGNTPAPLRRPSAGSFEQLKWAAPSSSPPPRAAAVDACNGVILVGTEEGRLFSCGSGIALGHGDSHTEMQCLTALPGLPAVGAFSVGVRGLSRRDEVY
eukprot:COSAG01_NODE_842_length_13174_cov_44.463250_2_plen_243_part_00